MRCCAATFCFNCAIGQADIINRCFQCNSVINLSKYEEYDGLDLKIPSYDEFDYINPEEIYIPDIVVEDQYSTPLIVGEDDPPVIDPIALSINSIEAINFQLNFQYTLFMAMFSQYLNMKEE